MDEAKMVLLRWRGWTRPADKDGWVIEARFGDLGSTGFIRYSDIRQASLDGLFRLMVNAERNVLAAITKQVKERCAITS